MRRIALVTGILLASVALSFGQVPPARPTVTIDSAPLITQIVPYLTALVLAIISAVGTVAISAVNKWGATHGVVIDNGNRDALLSAIKNVAAGALAKGAAVVEANGKVTIKNPSLITAAVKDVIENRAPDAVEHFDLTPSQVADRIVEQMPIIAPPVQATK